MHAIWVVSGSERPYIWPLKAPNYRTGPAPSSPTAAPICHGSDHGGQRAPRWTTGSRGAVRGPVRSSPGHIVRSPGRVNLIGDHTDYNDGFALPMAIDQCIWVISASRDDREIALRSNYAGDARLHLDRLERSGSWVNYVAGVLVNLVLPERGFDALIHSEVPIGAGLSSSASLELAIARLCSELASETWDAHAAALACQKAENDFVGVPSDLLDQLAIARAHRGHALLIDFRTLDCQPVLLPNGVTAVIMDTGTRRRLGESAYEDRRRPCERAASALGVSSLRDADLESVERKLGTREEARRARHVVSENQRTLFAAAALAAGDVAAVGEAMNQSHRSLRDDFEVSSAELDLIAGLGREQAGCHGTRQTGAGFAGCAVAFVDSDLVQDFVVAVGTAYREATSVSPHLYPTSVAAPVGLISPK